MPVAMVYNTGEITLLQCDGELTPEEVKEGLNLAKDAIGRIYQMQREALLVKYQQIDEESIEEMETDDDEEEE
jgi:exosome complex component RRP41